MALNRNMGVIQLGLALLIFCVGFNVSEYGNPDAVIIPIAGVIIIGTIGVINTLFGE